MKPVPKTVLQLIRQEQILFSKKAWSQIVNGMFSLDDLIHSIINGKLVKKEKDELEQASYKYVIIGPALSGTPLYSCGKIITHGENNYFVITFHEVR